MNPLYAQFLFYLNAFWDRRWIAIATAWLLCAAGWAGVAAIPDVYTSTGRIYVDTASILQPLLRGLAIDLDGDVNAQVSIMKQTLLSRPNLLKVARAISTEIDEPPEEDLAKVANRLSRATNVVGGRDNLFTITFDAPDPVEARDIVDALMTIFVETNVGANRADLDRARQFIDVQIKSYEVQLEKAEHRAATFKQENLYLLPGATGYHGRLERARTELELTRNGLREAIARRTFLAREMELVPEFLEFQTDDPFGAGPPTDEEAKITEIEFQLNSLLARYTESHPDVVTLRRKLESLYQQREQAMEALFIENGHEDGLLDQTEPKANARFRTFNPLHPQLRVMLLEENAKIEILQARVEEENQEVEALEKLAANVPLVEAEHAKLNRDYLVLKGKYQELLGRREAAKLSHEREIRRAEKLQFRIVDPPQVPDKPSGPNRLLFLAVVTLLGIGAPVVLVIGLTFVDQTFLDPDTLSKSFGVPIVGTVMVLPGVQQRLRRSAEFSIFLVICLSIPGALGALFYFEREIGLGNLGAKEILGDFVAYLTPLADRGG